MRTTEMNLVHLCFFSLSGTGQLVEIEGMMKSNDYVSILYENIKTLAQSLDLGRLSTRQFPEAFVHFYNHLDSEKK